MLRPDIIDSFVYEGQTVNVEWFDVDSVDNLPDVKWQQVYAIAELDGMVPLVIDKNDRVNLPGGHAELGETIEQTMRREIQEEMNCRVTGWRLLGYQKLTSEHKEPVYQARVFAELERIGEFTKDPDGSVVGHKLISLNQLNREIGYGKVGEHLITLVSQAHPNAVTAKYKYKIVSDIKRDAWNWWNGCNQTGYGVDWKQRVDAEVTAKIVDTTKDEAFEFLLPYLKEKYAHDESVGLGERFIKKRFGDNFAAACDKLVAITNKPLYRNDFTIYLTTFPRGPYNYEQGAFWLPVMWVNPIASFMHETLHFQFIHYWREDQNSTVAKLSNDDFEMLKEALTVVLDKTLVPLIEKPDQGYDIHQALRAKL